ncbi:GNAT family N-acetyltransferase [Streptomyces sp. NPDC047022]|uniref:GNAT family N-acetyltransferase n=1 Tax=Streptomyces sp. NPDC047022 TaxID=3155737 RepID=UPI0033C3D8B5
MTLEFSEHSETSTGGAQLTSGLVATIDRYFDAAPRPDADAVEVGAFTLFVSRTPWSYYARPSLHGDLPIESTDLELLAAACRKHGVDLSVEWVHEVRPELREAARAYGLSCEEHALMAATADQVRAQAVPGVTLRVVEPDDDALLAGRAIAEVSFGFGGTAVGEPGVVERDAALARISPEMAEHLRYRARSGLTVTVVAETADEGVVAAGSYQPMGPTAEVLAVATLPSARRRGIAAALSARLAQHAHGAGVETAVLSAQDADVVRVYERAGFTAVGTVHAAEPGQD